MEDEKTDLLDIQDRLVHHKNAVDFVACHTKDECTEAVLTTIVYAMDETLSLLDSIREDMRNEQILINNGSTTVC